MRVQVIFSSPITGDKLAPAFGSEPAACSLAHWGQAIGGSPHWTSCGIWWALDGRRRPAMPPREEKERTRAKPAPAFGLGPTTCPSAHQAWAMGDNLHRHLCGIRWCSDGRRTPPCRRGKRKSAQEPNWLLRLAQARRHARWLAGPGPWAVAPTGIRATSVGVRPAVPLLRKDSSCYGSRTGSRIWLRPSGVPAGSPGSGHGRQPRPVFM